MDRHEWTDEEGDAWEVDRAKAPGGAHQTLRYAPSLHTMAREILRLAEEVERLKAERTGAITTAVLANVDKALRLERARIRRELTSLAGKFSADALVLGDRHGAGLEDAAEHLQAEISRIVPGEG